MWDVFNFCFWYVKRKVAITVNLSNTVLLAPFRSSSATELCILTSLWLILFLTARDLSWPWLLLAYSLSMLSVCSFLFFSRPPPPHCFSTSHLAFFICLQLKCSSGFCTYPMWHLESNPSVAYREKEVAAHLVENGIYSTEILVKQKITWLQLCFRGAALASVEESETFYNPTSGAEDILKVQQLGKPPCKPVVGGSNPSWDNINLQWGSLNFYIF